MSKKACGECNACCIGPRIDAIQKPMYTACPNLTPGRKGCGIYGDRPAPCRQFSCGWLNTPEMPSRFRPDRCGILTMLHRRGRIVVWELEAEYEGSRLQRWLTPRSMYPIEVVKREQPDRLCGSNRG